MTNKPLLQVIVGSTRPGRVGISIAQWFYDIADARDEFDVEFVDLAEVNLPVYDEPHHPRLQKYVHEHTKNWSQIIERADAYVFVIPEYNHSINGATKNAIDFLNVEWQYKPYGIVCYGGASMGLRAATALKPVLAQLKMVWVGDVSIPLMMTPVVDGEFKGNDILVESSKVLLDELATFTPIYQDVRA